MPRGRKLNIPLVKGVVMLVVGCITAVGSAISGIGGQVAATPVAAFLLGYGQEKAAGTGMAFALFASASAVAGLAWGGVSLDLLIAVLLAAGATLGTMVVGRAAAAPRLTSVRRLGQTLGIVIGLLVLQEGIRRRFGGPPAFSLLFLVRHPDLSALAVGVVAGILAGLLQLSTGVLLVPVLVYVLAQTVGQAVGLSLAVVALAAALPVLSYSSRQLVDRTTGRWMVVGGILGGAAGGFGLAHLPVGSPVPLVAFGLIAMFLSAWQLWRAS